LAEQWIVAPKVVGSNPSSYLMYLFKIFNFYNNFTFNIFSFKKEITNNFLIKTYFIVNYYFLNDLIWQEGLLIDFLQKKIIDNWVKKFLIYSSYLFNERLVFDKIVKFYLDLLIWPMHKLFIFEFNNINNTLFITLFVFILTFLIITLIFLLSSLL
jgi:hypothetical protein